MRLTAHHRVAILLHEGIQDGSGKTGLAFLRYSDVPVVAAIDQACAGQSLPHLTGIPCPVPIVASLTEALAQEPDVLLIGLAPAGGALPEVWWQEVEQAVAAGLSVVNGLHTPMETHPALRELLRPDQWIWDVRREPAHLTVGSAQARLLSCTRVLMVGTDMAVGKMASSLELHRALLQRGTRSKFIATGQTGLMIAGDGVPLDAVRVDFAAGAVEQVVMRFGPDYDVLCVEGQGSLLHPASTATLPLLRGTQPTHLVLAHRAGQTHIRNHPHALIPPLAEVVRLYELVASGAGAFASTRVVAIALNTAHLDESAAQQAVEQVQVETGLPCTDPVRYGAGLLADAVSS